MISNHQIAWNAHIIGLGPITESKVLRNTLFQAGLTRNLINYRILEKNHMTKNHYRRSNSREAERSSEYYDCSVAALV